MKKGVVECIGRFWYVCSWGIGHLLINICCECSLIKTYTMGFNTWDSYNGGNLYQRFLCRGTSTIGLFIAEKPLDLAPFCWEPFIQEGTGLEVPARMKPRLKVLFQRNLLGGFLHSYNLLRWLLLLWNLH